MRRKYFSLRAIGLHIALILWVVLCAAARHGGRSVAPSRATRSVIIYAIEWPMIGGARCRRLVLHVEHGEGHRAPRSAPVASTKRRCAREAQAARERPRTLKVKTPRWPPTTTTSRSSRHDAEEAALGSLVDATFRRYRLMSYITGTTLLVLFVTLLLHTVDLSFWNHMHLFVDVVGIGHGIVMYPIYMIMCFNLMVKFRLNVFYSP